MTTLMTVSEYDKVQRRAPDRPPWAKPLPMWARDLPPVESLSTEEGAGPYISDRADYEAQMLHLLGLD